MILLSCYLADDMASQIRRCPEGTAPGDLWLPRSAPLCSCCYPSRAARCAFTFARIPLGNTPPSLRRWSKTDRRGGCTWGKITCSIMY